MLAELGIVHDDLETVPPLRDLLHPRHLIVLNLGISLRVQLHNPIVVVELELLIRAVEGIERLVLVEVALLALRDQHRVHNLALDASAEVLWIKSLFLLAAHMWSRLAAVIRIKINYYITDSNKNRTFYFLDAP